MPALVVNKPPRLSPSGPLLSKNPIGAGCDPLSSVFYVDGGTKTPVAEQNGSECRPYATIGQALAALGAPVDAADQARVPAVMVAAGIYDENLIVPSKRSVSFFALGEVVLGGPNNAGDVSQVNNFGSPGVSPVALSFSGTFFFQINGSVVVSSIAGANAVVAVLELTEQAGVSGNVDYTGFVGSTADVNLFGGSIGANLTGAMVALVAQPNAQIGGVVDIQDVDQAHGVQFFGNLTVSVAGSGFFFDCLFAPGLVFDGPVGSFRTDGSSLRSFLAGGGTFSATASIVLLEPTGTQAQQFQDQLAADFATIPPGDPTFQTVLSRAITIANLSKIRGRYSIAARSDFAGDVQIEARILVDGALVPGSGTGEQTGLAIGTVTIACMGADTAPLAPGLHTVELQIRNATGSLFSSVVIQPVSAPNREHATLVVEEVPS